MGLGLGLGVCVCVCVWDWDSDFVLFGNSPPIMKWGDDPASQTVEAVDRRRGHVKKLCPLEDLISLGLQWYCAALNHYFVEPEPSSLFLPSHIHLALAHRRVIGTQKSTCLKRIRMAPMEVFTPSAVLRAIIRLLNITMAVTAHANISLKSLNRASLALHCLTLPKHLL